MTQVVLVPHKHTRFRKKKKFLDLPQLDLLISRFLIYLCPLNETRGLSSSHETVRASASDVSRQRSTWFIWRGVKQSAIFFRVENVSDWFLTFHLLVSCGAKITHTITCTMISSRKIVPLSCFSILEPKGRHQQHLSKSPRMDCVTGLQNYQRGKCFHVFKHIN